MTIVDIVFVVVMLGIATTIGYLNFRDMFKQIKIDKERCIAEEDKDE